MDPKRRRRPWAAGLATLVLLAAGCGGRAVNRQLAQRLLRDLPDDLVGKDDVEVESVSDLGGRHAIVEARVRTAFKIERIGGRWRVREVRVARRGWEKIEDLARALDATKAAATRELLEQVARALELYVRNHGAAPDFTSYVALADRLHPNYLNPLVRGDAWGRPLGATRISTTAVEIRSAGPDARFGTPDDLAVTRTLGP